MTNKAFAIACPLVALLSAGTVAAQAVGPRVNEWGTINKYLGDAPAQVQSFSTLVAIDAGNKSDLAVLGDGSVWVWGNTEIAPASMTAIHVPGLRSVIHRPVDGNHDFAVIEQPGTDASCPTSSSVYTWGLNRLGDLGIGVSVQQTFSTPQDVTALDCQNVVAMAAGAQHMVALTGSGQVYVWGGGVRDTLGDGSIESSDVPVLNAAATALTGGTSSGVEVTAGSSIGGILVNGQAYVWGNNKQGECGCGSTMGGVDTPSAVEQGGLLFSFIDQGGDIGNNGHTLALTATGAVYAWGTGTNGQLGQGNTTNSSVPVLVPGLPVITDVRAGGVHSMALDAGGNVWAWGGNADGQVGNGTLTDVLTPVDVESGIGMISAGDVHSLSA